MGQFEASGAAAQVGPLGVVTLVGAESSGVMPALVDIYRTQWTHYGSESQRSQYCSNVFMRAQIKTSVHENHCATSLSSARFHFLDYSAFIHG